MEKFGPDTNPGGVIMALCNTVRVLIEHHPEPTKLMEALRVAHEQTIASLLAMPTKDGSVESYEDTLGLLGINQGGDRQLPVGHRP